MIPLDSGNYKHTALPKKWILDERIAEKLRFNAHLKISSTPYKFASHKSTSPPTNIGNFPSIRNLKSIFVSLYIEEQWQKDFCDKFILTSSQTLEELKFHFYYDQNFPSFSGTVFPKLKKLVTNSGRYRNHTNPPIKRICQAVTEAFPAFKYSNINCEDLYEISKLGLLQKFPL